MALDPTFVIAQTNLGSALVSAKDFAGAKQMLDAVAIAHPGDKFLALGRYHLAVAQNQTDAALKFALQADALEPGKPLYLFMAAQAVYAANRMDDAVGVRPARAGYGTR